MVEEKAERSAVQSVDRTIQLVEILRRSSAPLGVISLSERSGIAQATVHRLLKTLVQRGWVIQDADRQYALGLAVLQLGDPALRQIAIVAEPVLHDVMTETGETVNLAVLEGSNAVYVAQVPTSRRLRTFAEVGNRVPLYSTAVGKVLLATEDGPFQERSYREMVFVPRTARTITDLSRLRREIDSVARSGFAVDDAEEADDVRCVAVPVLDSRGRCLFALSIAGPATRIRRKDVAMIVEKLNPAAKRLVSIFESDLG